MEFIFTIAAIHLVACLSPGPDIFLVVLNSLRHGWKWGVATTFGILSGVSLHIAFGLTGISYLMMQGKHFENGISLAGGAMLLFLGAKGLRGCLSEGSRQTGNTSRGNDSHTLTFRAAWSQGFLVNLLNPKALLFFLSLFSVMLGPELPIRTRIASGVVMIGVQAIAFSMVAIIVDRPGAKSTWTRIQFWLEVLISSILLVLGVGIWVRVLASVMA